MANEAAGLRNKLAAAKPEEVEDVVEAEDEIAAEDEHGAHVPDFVEFPESLRPLPADESEDGGAMCGDTHPATEFWGEVVRDGSKNIQASAGKCCESCRQSGRVDKTRRACTVWVWHPTSHECWLKFDDDPNPKPHDHGAHVPWTSGVVPKRPPISYRTIDSVAARTGSGIDKRAAPPPPPTCLHTVLSSSGNAYMNWQTRVMYATYLKYAAAPGSVMKAFTRVLHRGKDDELMMEIPTMRFEPNQGQCDTWCDYPVADRSLAIAQWSKTTDSMRCSHVMMVETDYIYIKTAPPSVLLPPGQAVGFKYGYISPYESNMKGVLESYYADNPDVEKPPGPFKLPQTGNAPSCLNVGDLRRVAPLWAEFVERTQRPESLRKAMGWLRDMYAYDAAALVAGVEHTVAGWPDTLLMAQPPADESAGNAFILHYTWGPEIYDKAEKQLWMFDKRAYGGGQYMKGPYALTPLAEPPTFDEATGLQLQTFFQPRRLSRGKLELIRTLVGEFNEAVGKLPRIPKGHATLEMAEAMASTAG